MTEIIYSTSGKIVEFLLFVKNNGVPEDSLTDPVINNVYYPDQSADGYFPQNMEKIDTGTYLYAYQLLNGPASLGNFIADIQYTHPNGNVINTTYQVIVRRTNGLAGNFRIIV